MRFNPATVKQEESSYIHKWPLHSNCQGFNLTSHATYFVCVNFVHKWWDLQYKFDSFRFDRFLRSFFIATLFTCRVFARNLLRCRCRRDIFMFSFWCLTWGLNSDLMSNKLKHYLLELRRLLDTSYQWNKGIFSLCTCITNNVNSVFFRGSLLFACPHVHRKLILNLFSVILFYFVSFFFFLILLLLLLLCWFFKLSIL